MAQRRRQMWPGRRRDPASPAWKGPRCGDPHLPWPGPGGSVGEPHFSCACRPGARSHLDVRQGCLLTPSRELSMPAALVSPTALALPSALSILLPS